MKKILYSKLFFRVSGEKKTPVIHNDLSSYSRKVALLTSLSKEGQNS